MLNLNYSDPQDADLGVPDCGTVNQAYEGEDLVDPQDHVVSPEGSHGYRLKLGQEIYYCKPYRPFHTQLRYNFSGIARLASISPRSCLGSINPP